MKCPRSYSRLEDEFRLAGNAGCLAVQMVRFVVYRSRSWHRLLRVANLLFDRHSALCDEMERRRPSPPIDPELIPAHCRRHCRMSRGGVR